MKKYIRFDWAIKYLLRNKANFDVLEAFLSNLLKEDIKIEEILESESNRKSNDLKFNRVDLKCKDASGQYIIIEIQNQREIDYLQRILWGTSKAVVESLDLGEEYREVVKVISVSILYYNMRLDEAENTDFIYYGTTDLTGMHTKKPLVLHEKIANGEKVSMITAKDVFPEYYLIYVEKFNDIIQDNIDEWVYFFKHGEIREDFKSPGIKLAAEKLDYTKMSEKDKRAYDEYLAYLAQEKSILEAAREEGLEKGLEKGLQEGLKKGLEKGRKEGRDEGKVRVAKNLLRKGINSEQVAQLSELPLTRIKSLSNKQ